MDSGEEYYVHHIEVKDEVTISASDEEEEVVVEEEEVEVEEITGSKWARMFSMMSALTRQVADIDRRLKKIESQQHQSLSNIQQKVTKIGTKIAAFGNVPSGESNLLPQPITAYFSPAKCKEDLDELEANASDEQFVSAVAQSVARIHGYDRVGEGVTVSHQIVDYFFDRQFLQDCSWTGRSRSAENVRKIALAPYENIKNMFYQSVHLVDDSFTLNAAERFFRDVAKHARSRAEVKFLRKPALKRRKSRKKLNALSCSSNDTVKKIVENQLRHLQATLL
ncbi:uncharacterized protein LOC126581702 [Anopheles aquasalis]|uniref:uncharacterized protein LOC126581702 n=1 Tax=Anopheles aquasalis TaxID=42839 RepID=UPI00215B2AA3|nr:uncharacterized protein LOC126581702 [Anopheles aquasalis]